MSYEKTVQILIFNWILESFLPILYLNKNIFIKEVIHQLLHSMNAHLTKLTMPFSILIKFHNEKTVHILMLNWILRILTYFVFSMWKYILKN